VSRIGYKLYERHNSPFWWVYFSNGGRVVRRSTGVPLARRRDAEKKAAEILVESYEAKGRPVPDAIRELDVFQLSEMWIDQMQTGSATGSTTRAPRRT
jgi:hypothetical protein